MVTADALSEQEFPIVSSLYSPDTVVLCLVFSIPNSSCNALSSGGSSICILGIHGRTVHVLDPRECSTMLSLSFVLSVSETVEETRSVLPSKFPASPFTETPVSVFSETPNVWLIELSTSSICLATVPCFPGVVSSLFWAVAVLFSGALLPDLSFAFWRISSTFLFVPSGSSSLVSWKK